MVVTSFIPLWFFKFTLSENFASALFWSGLLQFLIFLRSNKPLNFFSFALALFLLTFSRIEAWGIIFTALFVLRYKFKNWSFANALLLQKTTVFFTLAAFFLVLANLILNWAYYHNFAKAFLDAFSILENDSGQSFNDFGSLWYLMKIFGLYGLLSFFIRSIISFIYFWKRKNYELLIPFLITLPIWIYILNPSISPDHPWMLRRYSFVIQPIIIFYSVIFLDHFFQKKLAAEIILAILLAVNLTVSLPYLQYFENRELISKVEEISSNFSPNDLILVDREVTGQGFSMISGPMSFLYGKQAVYFFNPQDIDKINQSRFDSIYFRLRAGQGVCGWERRWGWRPDRAVKRREA